MNWPGHRLVSEGLTMEEAPPQPANKTKTKNPVSLKEAGARAL